MPGSLDGETLTRTGDTTIFQSSRSGLAGGAQSLETRRREPPSRQFSGVPVAPDRAAEEDGQEALVAMVMGAISDDGTSMDSESDSGTWDCIIVGAGPAGLNAALVLGRARRRVLVLDNAQPRNYATHEMHGVLGHDGLDPADLRARGRTELGRYGVEVVTAEVQEAEVLDGTVRVTSSRGADLTRTVLLATGMLDEVPDIPGFAEIWGTTAHTCPYCDGFEHRDERLAILAAGARGEHLAILLRQWSDDVVLLSNGPHGLDADQLARVQALGIPIIETPVVALDSDDGGRLRRLRLDDGETLARDALFFYVGWQLRNDIARWLGCQLRDDGSIAVDSSQATTVDRVYAAGNCADPRALVPAAAGSAATAAVAINARLSVEDADHAVTSARAPAPEVR
jgi:thioredoxin reductase